MKRIIIVGLCLLLTSTAYGENSKQFSVMWSLLDSLHLLDWGSSYEVAETDDMTGIMTKLMNQNSKYENASHVMEEYINDKDEYISGISKGITGGSLALIDANNKALTKMKQTANLEEEGFKDIEYTVAETLMGLVFCMTGVYHRDEGDARSHDPSPRKTTAACFGTFSSSANVTLERTRVLLGEGECDPTPSAKTCIMSMY